MQSPKPSPVKCYRQLVIVAPKVIKLERADAEDVNHLQPTKLLKLVS